MIHKIQNSVGIGLRSPHYNAILTDRGVPWIEVHTENFLTPRMQHFLHQLTAFYSISLHGLCLSVGSQNRATLLSHLKRVKPLVDLIQPVFVSEHLAWSTNGLHYLHDLLPIPYTEESLQTVSDNIRCIQDYLQRNILIENPSSYLEYQMSTYPEADFLAELVDRTKVKLLLDINNVYVSSMNHRWNPVQYLQTVTATGAVSEIHLAGHSIVHPKPDFPLYFDNHGSSVCQAVLQLYQQTLLHTGNVPTLIERDCNIPSLQELFSEARSVQQIMDLHHATSL